MGPGPIIASIVGAVIAIMAGFGLVSATSGAPAPVDKPFIVYGSS